jgi:SET domain-containing protein
VEKNIVYKPLPEEVTVRKSKIDGLGLFSIKKIEKGHVFGISHISDYRFKNGFIRTPLGGFINHSEEPNCRLGISHTADYDCLNLISIKDIPRGTEITTKYSLYGFKNEDKQKIKRNSRL